MKGEDETNKHYKALLQRGLNILTMEVTQMNFRFSPLSNSYIHIFQVDLEVKPY